MSNSKMSLRDKVLLILSIITIIVIILGVAVYYLMNTKITKKDETGEVKLTTEIKTPEVVQDKSANFLIVGVSDDPNERSSTRLTDTIMVVNVDFEHKKASALQIPRDTYVGNATSTGKINAIYSQKPDKWNYSGLQGLVDMVYKTFKLNIDHYITMQMDGFREIVDAIGGVTMNVPVNMELNGTRVKAGEQTLNGKQAIAVVRTRNVYANADIGRLDTQKLFITALADKILSLDPIQMAKLIPIILKSVSTDITLNDALKYYNTASGIDLSNVVMMTVPGVPKMIKGQSVYCVYPQRTTALINKYFKQHSEQITPEQLELSNKVAEPAITPEEMENIAYLSDLKNGVDTEVTYSQTQ